ncbi:hypothetical protein D3Y57_04115 (plasmid) [Sphingomonas paeninsulae]|uniref:Uncharacterized protein n=1 Tax=Sphingomonas paeninsulae TaxID=2319844 RepID=A0A494T754_SPHPE|nr:hypothetical protein [Sphingomonas paeninsulae]AYJ85219.1 hypothetical protein D3Y57_04115 [Sphingomonas paeninsulae]
MTSVAVLQDLTLANARLLQALDENDTDAVNQAVAVMTKAIEGVSPLAHALTVSESRDMLDTLSGSLGATAQRVEDMTGLLRRRRVIMALPTLKKTCWQSSA